MALSSSELLAEITQTMATAGGDSVIALAGVPGTGKSHLASEAALIHAKHPLFVTTVQFHQAYGYEEFIEGLRPTVAGGFEVSDGSFFKWNEQAGKDPENRYVIVVEELTRANLPVVMGELLTLIEYRGRPLSLPISGRQLAVAPNITLLATFNPHDRNVVDIDDAILRRMRVIDCPPSSSQLREMLSLHLTGQEAGETLDRLADLFDQLEAELGDRFASTMPFGHGIFASVRATADLRQLWHQRIRHFLQRPGQPAHELADRISELYPWK